MSQWEHTASEFQKSLGIPSTLLFFFPSPDMLWERIFLIHWLQCLSSKWLLTLAPDVCWSCSSHQDTKPPLCQVQWKHLYFFSFFSVFEVIEILLLHGALLSWLPWRSSSSPGLSLPSLTLFIRPFSRLSLSCKCWDYTRPASDSVFSLWTLILVELIHLCGFIDQSAFWYFQRLSWNSLCHKHLCPAAARWISPFSAPMTP